MLYSDVFTVKVKMLLNSSLISWLQLASTVLNLAVES